MIKVICRF